MTTAAISSFAEAHGSSLADVKEAARLISEQIQEIPGKDLLVAETVLAITS